MVNQARSIAALLLLAGLSTVAKPATEEPVKIIATYVTELHTPSGNVKIPFDVSLDWSKPQPSITRAVILLHGKGRDVDGYYKGLQRAASEAGAASASSILVAPQFLNEHDIEAHNLPKEIVRWRTGAWEAGGPAIGPAPVSAYEVLDAMLLHLANKTLFPNLKDIVLAGHSGGGQAVQRYARGWHGCGASCRAGDSPPLRDCEPLFLPLLHRLPSRSPWLQLQQLGPLEVRHARGARIRKAERQPYLGEDGV